MTLEDVFQANISSMVGPLVTAVIAVNGLFIKWLVSNFHKIEASMQEISNTFNKHEYHDQQRFEKISVALARLGSTNGTYDKDKN